MIQSEIREFIFEENREAPSCHASTVLPLEGGRVLAAWFAGAREGADDVSIWLSIRKNGAWSCPRRITPEDGVPHWNPVLYRGKDGAVRLFYKAGRTIQGWKTWVTVSRDGGGTWSEPRLLVEDDTSGGRGPVKNKCLLLSDGTLLAPASTEQENDWRAFLDRSRDDGGTWERTAFIGRPRDEKGRVVQMIQPTLWEAPEGQVHALMRTNAGRLYRSDSVDGGLTWCGAYPTEVPNNNSGVDLARSGDGRLWLLCNPVGEDWGGRTPLTLLVSGDNGESWEKALDLETEPGEYSYPAIVCQGGTLYAAYTWQRRRIVFVQLKI